MNVERLDHIHVYVKDLDKAMEFFTKVTGAGFSKVIISPEFGFKSVLDTNGIELIAPTRTDSHIAKSIAKRGEGLAAISFKVPNIHQEIKRFESLGIHRVGSFEMGSIIEAQFNPKDFFGIQLELCQYNETHPAILAADTPRTK